MELPVEVPVNEPVLGYAPGSPERAKLIAELTRQASADPVEIPCMVAGSPVFTGDIIEVRNPSDHRQLLARVHRAQPKDILTAIEGGLRAKQHWSRLKPEQRIEVFQRAADILANTRRELVNAATMLGQGKTPHQAEIDAICELVDFWRFNAWYYLRILLEQPPVSPPGVQNRTEHRPLDGFVAAIAPFNFTSIALNLATAPALTGNCVMLKPAPTSSLAVCYLYQILIEAGMPPEIISLLNGEGADVGDLLMTNRDLGGVHFTGSTATFRRLNGVVGSNIANGIYRGYPRVVGETGGKDFIVAHPSADPQALAVAIVRGAFEYQGQKCSAASRIYVPRSLWPEVSGRVIGMMREMKIGNVTDFSNFVGPVIDKRAFDKISGYIQLAYQTAEVLAGGLCDDSVGWFIHPTLVEVTDPRHRLMCEEIFGPVATVFVYDDSGWNMDKWRELLQLVDTTSPYALTGAVFTQDAAALAIAFDELRDAAGNFYINDKPTGAVVGQQPFGGGRASGTNDKAGAADNLRRWISARTVKVTEAPPIDWRYPFLG